MESIFIVGIVFISIYKIIELFVLQRERTLMIKKMDQISTENVNSLLMARKTKFQSNQYMMLRFGALALGIGAGWILGLVLNEAMSDSSLDMWQFGDSIFFATVALCVGIALIIVYLIERRGLKQANKEE